MRVSTMAEVNRERVLLVGGQRALVMQLAHPLVAAGVTEHSDFPARPMERLRRTLDLSLALIYGTDAEAEAASAGIRAVHERVTGSAGGRPYAANDPDLLLWVNATLVDTTLLVYERFVRPLPERDRRRYYLETVEAAELFGIPRAVIPGDLDAFRAYLGRMLEGPKLRATAEGRRLVADVLRPPLPVPLRVPTAAVRLITLSLLPERIRSMFGLRAGLLSRAALATASRASRLLLPVLPAAMRQFSAARAAPGGQPEGSA
ncbi:MAG: oxygenase MpaB family protein [Actinomycetota bacterium]